MKKPKVEGRSHLRTCLANLARYRRMLELEQLYMDSQRAVLRDPEGWELEGEGNDEPAARALTEASHLGGD